MARGTQPLAQGESSARCLMQATATCYNGRTTTMSFIQEGIGGNATYCVLLNGHRVRPEREVMHDLDGATDWFNDLVDLFVRRAH